MAINLSYKPDTNTIHEFNSTSFLGINTDFLVPLFEDVNVEDPEQKKLIALYAIMHNLAYRFPGQEINLTVDDSGLEQVKQFDPRKMPDNVTLILGTDKEAPAIKGSGGVDVQFTETIKRETADLGFQVLVREEIVVENTTEYPPFVIDQKTERKFNAAMKAIKDKERELSSDHEKDSLHARALHDAFTFAYGRLKATGNINEFEETTRKAIEVAKKSSLKDHRGYKQILGYAVAGLLAVLGSVSPALLIVAGYVFNAAYERESIFRTDSIARVENLENVAKGILAEKPEADEKEAPPSPD